MTRPQTLIPMLVLLTVAGWAAACGDGAMEPPTPDPPRATTLTVTPATAGLTALGETVRLATEVRDQNGQAMAGTAVTWSSGDPTVATVDPTGLVTAAGNGTATITATSGSASGSATVTVAQAVSAVAVSPAVDTLVARGDTVRLTAAASDANGHPVAEAEFSWASADTAVATVNATGLVTGVAAGEVDIAATSSGVTGRAALVVVDPAPAAVAVTPDTVLLSALGQTARLAAEVRDQIGRVIEGRPVVWSSADTAVAAVDTAGLVTAVGGGATKISATAGEVSGTAAVTVMQSAGSVVVSPAADTVAPGNTLRLAAEAFDENGHRVERAEFTWSSSNAAVARVDGSGLVTGAAEGTATITAAAGSASGTSVVTVENPDRAALVALYEATDGPNWRDNENWLTDAPLGEWYGVDTDRDGRVVRLALAGHYDHEAQELILHGLKGTVPPELGDLGGLTILDLSNNDLSRIPPELGNLSNLERLDLLNNTLHHSIPPELGNLFNLVYLDLRANMNGPIPPELGNLSNLEFLAFGSALTGPIPAELGNLSNLEHLDLGSNELTGPIPPELGNLSNLEYLVLSRNELTGPVPRDLLGLASLRDFFFRLNDGLCAPGTAEFEGWLKGMRTYRGPYCNDPDREALELLFETAGGAGWNKADRWLATQVLGEWYGVKSDSLGRVEALDLTGNGLTGALPSWGRSGLINLVELRIGGNGELAGRLPLALADWPIRLLHYADTGVCAPADAIFARWLNGIPSHEGTGAECAPLADREILEALYNETGGPDWTNNDNWLTEAPLGEWYGVETNDQGSVTSLDLMQNGLSGQIPRELGSLVNLGSLRLGSLSAQTRSRRGLNVLTGSIPSDLGNLVKLEDLDLGNNALTGSIPPELGNLGMLWTLDLAGNALTGSVPPELGRLSSLQLLFLHRNGLTGSLPSQFGDLADLHSLYLNNNDLTGPVPTEFGGLDHLRDLVLAGNAGLSGALPASLTGLRSLETFFAGGTELCAPPNVDFLRWLGSVSRARVARCGSAPAMAYLVQPVQSREFPVPVIADKEALLRVFVTAARANDARLPRVRASFHLGGAVAHVADVQSKPGPIPTEVDEGSLAASVNMVIPEDVVRPGLEMVIEVDPEGTLDPGLGVARRIPETGLMPIDVREVPVFELTVVPFLWSTGPDSTILEHTADMAADPEGHEMLKWTRTVLPVADLDVTAHEPVLTSSNDMFELLRETEAIRVMEAGSGYYMGVMSRWPAAGVAHQGGRVSFSFLDNEGRGPVAHELGHNFDLGHAPCGGANGPDPAFPYPDGSIGAWGYDSDRRSLRDPSRNKDLMSYCGGWISDYHFTKALDFRLAEERDADAAPATGAATSLLLWGGVDSDSTRTPFLEPAFVVDAPPALPTSAGQYQISGRTETGAQLFSLRFTMPETADGDGSSSFAFVLPVRSEWEGNLASISLTGPGGSFTLDGDSDIPMAILRDSQTGQVRGFLRDPTPATQAAADAVGHGVGTRLEVLFSRGIPGAEAWRR